MSTLQDNNLQINEIEDKLINIFKEVLNLKDIKIDEEFFELGGNSLLLMKLITKIRNEFNIELAIEVFFKVSNISQLAIEIQVINFLINNNNNNNKEVF